MGRTTSKSTKTGLQPWTIALNEALSDATTTLIRRIVIAGSQLELRHNKSNLWAVIGGSKGGFAVLLATSPGQAFDVQTSQAKPKQNQCQASEIAVTIASTLGDFIVQVSIPDLQQPLIHFRVTLKPSDDLQIPFWPRDLYPIDTQGGSSKTKGVVHAAQRGMNVGLLYLTLSKPKFGSLVYFQNLTSLNDYCLATNTKPDGCVGGEWPELGLQLPQTNKALQKNKRVVISDGFVHWSSIIPKGAGQTGKLFLDLLANIYLHLDRPAAEYHNWIQRSEETLADLKLSSQAKVRQYRHNYLRPYTNAELPDSMVQLATIWPMRAYETWLGKPIEFADELMAGMRHFYDPKLRALRRYLPSATKESDKNTDEVDSWYLYHPLASLGRMALEGYKDAQKLFLDSLKFTMKVARKFDYQWPVMFNINTLEVIRGERKEGEYGQTDLGGLYAYVMIQAYLLTHQAQYLREATKAIDTLAQHRFDLMYQANITAWGAVACLLLSRLSGKGRYLEQSYMLLATFFHNSILWQSALGTAQHFPTFMGVTCLSDAPYMAAYEEFESYVAFNEYLTESNNKAYPVPDSVILLLSEYCKYAISRVWYYYPRTLPKSAVAKKPRNGLIDRRLAFPLEDLYCDGQPAGQVGQEVYGSGAALKFTAYSYHRIETAPFLLFCEYPISDISVQLNQPTGEQTVRFHVGGKQLTCQVYLIPTSESALPPVQVSVSPSKPPQQKQKTQSLITQKPNRHNQIVFEVPADCAIQIIWKWIP